MTKANKKGMSAEQMQDPEMITYPVLKDMQN